MELRLIAAIGRNNELGLKGDMPWGRSLKKDLAFFSKTTKGSAMVMGRKTFESLGGLLPGRKHIVITSRPMDEQENLVCYPSLEAFQEAWKDYDKPVYVIGGASIYGQMLEDCDQLILTEIDQGFDADTWFPSFDKSLYEKNILDRQDENGIHYEHVLYQKK